MKALRQVSRSCFGTKLHPSWRQHLHTLRYCLREMVANQGMSLTTKLHVLSFHVEEWIDRHGRSMGKEGEQAVRPCTIFGSEWLKARVK